MGSVDIGRARNELLSQRWSKYKIGRRYLVVTLGERNYLPRRLDVTGRTTLDELKCLAESYKTPCRP